MRNLLKNNNLRIPYAPRATAKAFSLVELIISVGILVLLLSLAGQVFNFTVQSTGQATALTGINQTLRMLERTLRQDLANVQAGRSVLIIQGNPVNAYWTAEGQQADDNGDPADGYDTAADPDREDMDGIPLSPRADVLLFVTARRATSFVTPTLECGGNVGTPAMSQLQLVTYGMAELGDYTYDADVLDYSFNFYGQDDEGDPQEPVIPTDATGYPDPGEASRFPASQWHLFRRPTLLLPRPLSACAAERPRLMSSTLDEDDFRKLVLGESDMMLEFSLEEDLLRPDLKNIYPWYLPRFLLNNLDAPAGPLYAPSRLDPSPPPQLATRLGHYFVPNCASFKVEWTLDPQSEFVGGRLDGINEPLWFDPGDNGDPFQPNSGPDPLRSAANLIETLTAKMNATNNAATRIFLERRRADLESLIQDPWDDGSLRGGPCEQAGYSLQDRFRGNSQSHTGDPDCRWDQLSADSERPNLAVFTATRPKLFQDPVTLEWKWDGETVVPDPMFPGALRITVDLYDHEGRLERPIRHVMMISLGG